MERHGLLCLRRYNILLYAGLLYITLCLCILPLDSRASELKRFRLLSISESEKLILVSQLPGKTKYLLDASAAKISIDGKPAEFKDLKSFSIIQLKLEPRKSSRLGIRLDGVAMEIQVNSGPK